MRKKADGPATLNAGLDSPHTLGASEQVVAGGGLGSAHSPDGSDRKLPLVGYEVLLAVCGGIAAYKVCYVVSDLVQRGAKVRVAMTRSSRRFVGPLTFHALTGRAVLTSLWPQEGQSPTQHISVTESADLFVVAPATANILGKMACGLADEIVSTLALSVSAPILIAPAMNQRMWAHAAVQANVETLRSRGATIVDPVDGWLACRDFGPGRMAEPSVIAGAIEQQLLLASPKAHQDPAS